MNNDSLTGLVVAAQELEICSKAELHTFRYLYPHVGHTKI
jgi:hypothetical protein